MREWREEVRRRMAGAGLGGGEEAEVVEELAQHLADRYEELRAEGVPEEEARSLTLEELTDEGPLAARMRRSGRFARPEPVPVGAGGGDGWWRAALHDLRFGMRLLRRNPGFTAVAVLTLALGIGANTAIFSVVNAVLLRPLGYAAPERLYMLYQFNRQEGVGRIRVTPHDFVDWREETRAFEGVAAHIGNGFTLSGEGEPELVIGVLASAELFGVLGVRPLLGRGFLPEENQGGRNRVLVLSHGLWQRRFGGDPGVLGRSVTVNGKPFTVVGVMPRGFAYPGERYQLWAPLALRGAAPEDPPINRGSHYFSVVGRLRPGVTEERARVELAAISRRLAERYPESNANVASVLVPLREEMVGEVRTPLLVLLGAVGLVLLIACANVTSLLLARATTRRREVAVRAALGASRGRVVAQLLTENALIFALGALLGLLLAGWGVRALVALAPGDTPRLADASIDAPVLLFTLGVTLLTTLLFGLAPALQLTRGGPLAWLRSSGRTTASREGQRLRSALVVAEFALSLVLLVAAGLAIRSFARLLEVDAGFRAEGVATFSLVLPGTRYPGGDPMRAFHRELLERLRAQRPVEAVGTTTHLPMSGQDIENSFTVEGRAGEGGEAPVAGVRGVGGDYFRSLGIAIRRGRPFTPQDEAGAPAVAIVNEAFARRYWPNQNPIGRRLRMDGSAPSDPWYTVVGVSADVRHLSLAGEPRPEVYLPYAQLGDAFLVNWSRGVYVILRGRVDPAVLVGLARDEIRRLDPGMPLNDVLTMRERLSASMAEPRFQMLLLGMFGFIALALATVGIFGVMSFFVTQRTQEVGIRMALGARRSDLVALVVRRGMWLASAGIALGVVGALGVTRWMRALLFGVPAHDPATFLAVVLLLGATALLASYLPARRATRVDPVTALRAE